MTKQVTFSINPFFRRQTPESKFSYFDGTDEQLLKEVEQNFPLRKEGRRPGSYIVAIASVIGRAHCFTSVIKVNKYSFLNTEAVAKHRGAALICPSVIGCKRVANYAEVVLYDHATLLAMSEVSGEADYEIISLHVSDVENQPLHPYEIARQVLNEGASYSPREICEAIIYWGTHAFTKSQFHRHAHVDVANCLRKGNLEGAFLTRRTLVPDESEEESKVYIAALQTFMQETDTLYI